MVCLRSGSLALENAGDRSLVVCERRRVQSPMTISCKSKENVLGRNLLNCHPTVVPTAHFLLLIYQARGVEIRRGGWGDVMRRCVY